MVSSGDESRLWSTGLVLDLVLNVRAATNDAALTPVRDETRDE